MNAPILLHELTREKARELAPHTLLVLPVGAVEQHGPHLPVGTDYLTVEHVARGAAEQAQKAISVLVAPTLPFGSSHHHLSFGGTLSLATETYYRVLADLGESMIVSGFRSLVLINGHGGNHELIQLVARRPGHQAQCKVCRHVLLDRGLGCLGGRGGSPERSSPRPCRLL